MNAIYQHPVRLTLEMVEVGTARPGCRRRRVPAVRLPSGDLVIHRTPVLEACRVLIAQGVSPTARFEAWWKDAPHPALLGTVGGAAKLTVIESDRRGPRFAPYRAEPPSLSLTGHAHTRQTKAPATPLGASLPRDPGEPCALAACPDAAEQRQSRASHMTITRSRD